MTIKPGAGAKKAQLPWILDLEIPDHFIFAIQAVAAGTANAAQQREAFEFITNQLCAADKMSFWPGDGGGRATDFAEGKRFVGNSLKRIARLKAMTRPAHGETAEEDAAEAANREA